MGKCKNHDYRKKTASCRCGKKPSPDSPISCHLYPIERNEKKALSNLQIEGFGKFKNACLMADDTNLHQKVRRCPEIVSGVASGVERYLYRPARGADTPRDDDALDFGSPLSNVEKLLIAIVPFDGILFHQPISAM